VPESRSRWSTPLYSCASALKATVKTVSFNYNGTGEVLTNLVILGIQEKVYAAESDLPLWGVENTGNKYESGGINLIWGLISPEYETHPNVSTVRQKSLYLPGFNFSPASSQRVIYGDNLPGSEFWAGASEYTSTFVSFSVSSISPPDPIQNLPELPVFYAVKEQQLNNI
jgi:hypothetical protein